MTQIYTVFFNVIIYGENGCKNARMHKNADKTDDKKQEIYKNIMKYTSFVWVHIIRKSDTHLYKVTWIVTY